MKPVDVKDNNYINFDKEVNDKDPKLQVGDRVKMSIYKNIFVKGHALIGQKKFLLLSQLKMQFHGHM